MRKHSIIFVLAGAILSIVPLWLASPASAQTPGAERTFHQQKPEVEKAIQKLHATLNGRLPIFDGFVDKAEDLSDRYTRGYYECTVQVVADGQNDTRVRVTAKVTAWYADPDPVKSGYRVLLSNGRLETDLLDRVEDALGTKGPASTAPQSSQSGNSRLSSSTPRVRPGTSNFPALDKSPFSRSGPGAGSPGLSASPVEGVTAARISEEDIESLRHRREEAEKRVSALKGDVQSLEEILHNQTHPTDIAVVRKSGTRVMSKPTAGAQVLFSADAEDEFQVLDSGADWVRVQISGVSRGWIHRSDLNLPEGLDASSKKTGVPATEEPPFRVVREETNAFKGNWEPLKGKTVKIIWTEPASASVKSASALAKRNFAKSLLLKAYQEISSHDQEVAGVVIVFDSADGGQIAATLESLKQWQAGSLSEASFWRLCFVDPPELFQASLTRPMMAHQR